MPVSDINQVVLVGNLTKDPDLRETGTGTKVCELRLASNTNVKSGDNWESKPNYFQITAWGSMGENADKYLQKGSRVAVAGRLEWQKWDSAEGGINSRIVVIANNLQFLSNTKGKGANEAKKDNADTEDDIPF